MDVKPFIKRVFKAYRAGSKQPIKRFESYLYKGNYYKMTVFEVLKSNMGRSYWDGLGKAYVGNMNNGQIIRLEKSEEKERVLIALLTPHKEKNNGRQVGSEI